MNTVITLEQSAVPPVGEQLGGFRSVATSPQHGVQACQARPKKEDEPLFNSDRSSLPRMLNHPNAGARSLGCIVGLVWRLICIANCCGSRIKLPLALDNVFGSSDKDSRAGC